MVIALFLLSEARWQHVKGGDLMAVTDKAAVVEELRKKFEQANSIVITDYRGLNVSEVTELRRQLREVGVEYKVVKNTLTRLGAREANIEGLDEYLTGPTALAFSYDDPVAVAKILTSFAKDHKNLELRAGLLEGKLLDVAEVTALATLPSREILLGQVAYGFMSPVSGFVNALSGIVRGLVYALDGVRQQKADAAS